MIYAQTSSRPSNESVNRGDAGHRESASLETPTESTNSERRAGGEMDEMTSGLSDCSSGQRGNRKFGNITTNKLVQLDQATRNKKHETAQKGHFLWIWYVAGKTSYNSASARAILVSLNISRFSLAVHSVFLAIICRTAPEDTAVFARFKSRTAKSTVVSNSSSSLLR